MIAEEYTNNYQPDVSIPKGTTISCILNCFKNAAPFFKIAIKQTNILLPINENKLTQIFVEQLRVQLRKEELSFNVGNQYSDLFHGTKGVPDFYFHNLEEGKTSVPLFIAEAKRLPAPDSINEREYVIGKKQNGGMERFKIGKHGKGLEECGLLGFVEEKTAAIWLETINGWITELAKSTSQWKKDEALTAKHNEASYSYLSSNLRTTSNKNIILHHFWIL